MNGYNLQHVTHATAVSKFVGAGEVVNMVVVPGEESRRAVQHVSYMEYCTTTCLACCSQQQHIIITLS